MSFVLPVLCHTMPLLHPIKFFCTTLYLKYYEYWTVTSFSELFLALLRFGYGEKIADISVPYLFLSGLP